MNFHSLTLLVISLFFLLHSSYAQRRIDSKSVQHVTSGGATQNVYTVLNSLQSGYAVPTGNIIFDSIVFSEDITVAGQDIGGIEDGTTFSTGTTLTTFIKSLVSKVIPPVYTPPSFSISGDPSPGNIEIGTLIQPIITPSFTANDSGGLIQYRLLRTENGTTITNIDENAIQTYTAGDQFALENEIEFESFFSYSGTTLGQIKTNNFGEVDSTGSIGLANLAPGNTLRYTPYRKYFIKTDTNTGNYTDQDEIRTFDNGFMLNSAINITITAPVGTKQLALFYPASRGDLTKAVAKSIFDFDLLADPNAFKLNPPGSGGGTFNIKGADAYLSVPYKVYYWRVSAPITSPLTFEFTIPAL